MARALQARLGDAAGWLSLVCCSSPLLVPVLTLLPPLNHIYSDNSGTGYAFATMFLIGVGLVSALGLCFGFGAVLLLRRGKEYGIAVVGTAINGVFLILDGLALVSFF